MAVHLASEKKKIKKRKQKRSEPSEPNDKLYNSSKFDEDKPYKKQKKDVGMNAVQYKPGMLSDFLQKKKYGCLFLPWETSFSKDQSPGGLTLSEVEESEQKPKFKINPLFDMSKRKEENSVSKSNKTYAVFVGNLPQEITVNQVKKIFKKFGNTIRKIKIGSVEKKKYQMFSSKSQNIDKNDQSKHALVKFSSLESYEAALRMNGKLYKEHHLRITVGEDETRSDPDQSVFVGNLAVGTSDDDLWKLFQKCGEIDYVRVIRDRIHKKGNFGYVNFKSAKSVDEALELDGTSISNREIRVSRVKRNINSLSNSITVKRKKKKQTKLQLNVSDNEVNSSIVGNIVEDKDKKEERKKLSKNKTPVKHMEQESKPETPGKKKKKKKKKPGNGTERIKTSENE